MEEYFRQTSSLGWAHVTEQGKVEKGEEVAAKVGRARS